MLGGDVLAEHLVGDKDVGQLGLGQGEALCVGAVAGEETQRRRPGLDPGTLQHIGQGARLPRGRSARTSPVTHWNRWTRWCASWNEDLTDVRLSGHRTMPETVSL